MDLRKALESAKSTPSTAKPAIRIDKSKYMSIKEIAAYLDRSIYRTRQIGWEGLIGDEFKPEKEVYYLRELVEAYKRIQDARGMKNTDLDESRLGKRAKYACELVQLMINQDTSVSTEQKSAITKLLAGYIKQAEEMIKEK
jgi:hypothetical protein